MKSFWQIQNNDVKFNLCTEFKLPKLLPKNDSLYPLPPANDVCLYSPPISRCLWKDSLTLKKPKAFS